MKVCYFGIYDPQYPRNRILLKGLKKNGIEVIECRTAARGFWKTAAALTLQHWPLRGQYDLMIVGFLGHTSVILARLLTRKPIVFDAFISLYDSNVFDRKIFSPAGWRAGYYWFLDWLSCRLADSIILDTNAHIDYFAATFGVRREKFNRIFVGSDEEIVYPVPPQQRRDSFFVHFHGNFIPLQGVEYIVRAARLLKQEDIQFTIIGRGQTYHAIKALIIELKLNNISLIDSVPYQELKQYMADADLCLGIFGNTDKARRVIPNKVFEAMAARRPLLTGDSPAAREILTDRVNVLFCKMADAEDLAEKILELKSNRQLREEIAGNGFNLFQSQLRSDIIGKQLWEKLKQFSSPLSIL